MKKSKRKQSPGLTKTRRPQYKHPKGQRARGPNTGGYMNEAKYQTITKTKQAKPQVSLAALCREQGVSYNAYNNWMKKKGTQPASAKASTPIPTTTLLSFEELAKLVARGVKEVPVSVDKIVAALSEDEKRRLAEACGKLMLSKIGDGHDDGEQAASV